jgi:sugar phosphate permease
VGVFEMGLVLGAVKIGYALGQLVNGQLTERYGARRILGAGMIGSAVVTMLFAFAPTLADAPFVQPIAATVSSIARSWKHDDVSVGALPSVMIFLALLNGFFQAGGWPPCVKVVSRWFTVAQRGRAMGILGTSLSLGSATVIISVGALLGWSGRWRIAFVVPSAVLLLSAVHTLVRLRPEPPPGSEPQVVMERLPTTAASERPRAFDALWNTLRNGRIWVLALGLFGLDAVRYGFLDWAPNHLKEVHGTGIGIAALKTAVLPLAGAAGALSSGWISDRVFQSRRAPVIAGMLTMVAILTLAYRSLVGLGAVPTVVCLALVGFFLYGAQILLVGTGAQDFARGGATAAAAGFIDFVGHVGAFAGDAVTGWMLPRHGWAGVFAWWSGAAIVAAALVATLWHARPETARR